MLVLDQRVEPVPVLVQDQRVVLTLQVVLPSPKVEAALTAVAEQVHVALVVVRRRRNEWGGPWSKSTTARLLRNAPLEQELLPSLPSFVPLLLQPMHPLLLR